MEKIAQREWPNLISLNIIMPNISEKDLQHLSRGQWPKLLRLKITSNCTLRQGCKYLTVGKWPNLVHLDLRSNNICLQSCRQLTKAIWPKLKYLNLQFNPIKQEGLIHIAQAYWPNLHILALSTSFWHKIKEKDLERVIFKNFGTYQLSLAINLLLSKLGISFQQDNGLSCNYLLQDKSNIFQKILQEEQFSDGYLNINDFAWHDLQQFESDLCKNSHFFDNNNQDMCQFLCCDCWWFNCCGVLTAGVHQAYCCLCSWWLCKPAQLENIDPACCHVCACDGCGGNCCCWGDIFCAPQSVKQWSKLVSSGGVGGQQIVIVNNYN